jgi:Flp pilus assembly protein TadD
MKLQGLRLLQVVGLLGNSLCLCSTIGADSCQQAQEALQRNDWVQAESLLKRCQADGPGRLKVYLDLCGLYQMQGRVEDLARIAEEGLKKFPGESRFYLTVGNHAGRTGKFNRAVEVFAQAHEKWPEDSSFTEGLASAHVMLGVELLDKKQDEQAARHLREAVKLSDRDVEAHLNLGRALHNLNQSVDALAEFDRVLQLDLKTPLAHFHRGLVLNALGEYEEAIASLGQEIRLTPDYPPSYLIRGEALLKRGDWAAALSDLETAVRMMPENPKAVYARGRCLQQLGRLKDAETDFRKTVQMDPAGPEPLNALARLLWLTGQKQEAEALFRRARELSQAARTVQAGDIRFEAPAQRK